MLTETLTFNPLSSLHLSLLTFRSRRSFCGEYVDRYEAGAETHTPFSSASSYLNNTLTSPPTPSNCEVIFNAPLLYLTSIKYNITMIMLIEQSTQTPIHPLRALVCIVSLLTMDIISYGTVPMSVQCILTTSMFLIIPCDMCSSSSSSSVLFLKGTRLSPRATMRTTRGNALLTTFQTVPDTRRGFLLCSSPSLYYLSSNQPPVHHLGPLHPHLHARQKGLRVAGGLQRANFPPCSVRKTGAFHSRNASSACSFVVVE